MSVKGNSYVCIQAFMVNDLHLSGNELIIFAVIHGFSQDGESWFTGSRGYLADWCQTSKATISNNLAKLCAKGLIEKRTRIENGVTFNDYRAAQHLVGGYKKFDGGVQNIDRGGVQETCPHTLDMDIPRGKDKEKRAHFTPPTVEEVRTYCQERDNGIDAERFCDFYAAKGWKIGRETMKDWRACVRTWERRDCAKPPARQRDLSEAEKANRKAMEEYFGWA